MPIPQVRVISKQVVARPVQASGLTGLLLIQSERGPVEPVLVANMTEFMEKFSITGDVPEAATNISAYYSAQNFLNDSDRLWVRRVIAEGALYSVAMFQQEATPISVELDSLTLVSNTLTGVGSSIGLTGDCVTIYGADIPSGLVNGERYFLRQTNPGPGDYVISFYTSEQSAIDAVVDDIITLTDKGSGYLYVLPTESPESSGLDNPDGAVVISPQAFMIYSTDQGVWGNTIRITVEVPRVDEASIRCADAVDALAGTFPIAVPWIGDNDPGLPVHVIPVGSTSELPTSLSATTTYFATIDPATGNRVLFSNSLENALVPTTLTFASAGLGSMLLALVGSIAEINVGGVNGGTNTRLTTEFSAGNSMTIPCADTPIACTIVGSVLPAPLVQGNIYWAFRSGALDSEVRLAETYADAVSGNGLSIAVNAAMFNLLFFTTAQTVARDTGVVDCTTDIAFNCTDDVDEVADSIDVGATLYAALADEDQVFLKLASGALVGGLSVDTLYYVTKIPATTTITLSSDTPGGTAIALTQAVGTATVNISGTSYIKSNQRLETGTPIKFTSGNVPLVNGTTLALDTEYYVVEEAVTSGAFFKVKLALTKEDAADLTTVDFVGNAAGGAVSFVISPVNVYDNWDSSYDTISLDGAVYFGGLGNTDPATTIQLPLHSGSYQGWVPGEGVRIYPTGVGSILPYGLSSSITYYMLPLGDGKVQLCTKSGGALISADQLIPVKLDTASNKKGSGYFTIVSANDPLPSSTFRLKVWKVSETTSSVGGQASYAVTLEETYQCSLYTNLQDAAGRSLELERRVAASKYIRAVELDVTTPGVLVKAVPFLTALSGGSVGVGGGTISSEELISALGDFTDPNQYSLSYLMDGGYTYPDYQIALISLAESREDCIAVLSTPVELEEEANPARAIIEYVQNNLPSSSFGAMFTPWQLMTKNGVDILVPPDGFVAAQMSKVDSTKGAWYAAAGLEDGPVRSRGGSAKFSQANLDELYGNRINPIIRIADAGPTIWGNITLLALQSPLSRINVRKLMNKIQSELRKSLLQFVMVPIDSSTYARITALCEGYLGSIQTRRGIEEYLVVCNDTNNTAEDRDAQRINVWVYVKPTQVSEFVDLTTVVTPSSVSFTTIGV